MADAVTAPSNPSILNNPALIQQWLGILETLSPSATNVNANENSISTATGSSSADAGITAMITQLINSLAPGGATDQNVKALIAPIMASFKDSALPQIQGQANTGGGVYNSTTQQLLSNDALARAVAQSGGVMVSQQNSIQSQITNLLNILAQSTRKVTTVGSKQTAQSTQKTSQLPAAAKAAGAGAGLGALIKALTPIQPEFTPENQAATIRDAARDPQNIESTFSRTDGLGNLGYGESGGSSEPSFGSGNEFGGGSQSGGDGSSYDFSNFLGGGGGGDNGGNGGSDLNPLFFDFGAGDVNSFSGGDGLGFDFSDFLGGGFDPGMQITEFGGGGGGGGDGLSMDDF